MKIAEGFKHRPIPCAPGSGNVAVLLIGPPGSGKETHGKEICREFHGHHFSIGEHFRAQLDQGGDFARQFGDHMRNAVPLPDPVVIDGIREGFAHIPERGAGALLLDGFLKLYQQVWQLEHVLSHPIDALVLDFTLTREESIERAQRGRADDKKAGERFDKWMLEERKPVLKALRRRGLTIAEIVSSDPIDVVYNRVSRVISVHAQTVKTARPLPPAHEPPRPFARHPRVVPAWQS